jgi:NTP pyrophosphatase (non-canonical NTP hydrolase)
MPLADLDPVLDELRQFVAEREWSRFHDPKNLAMLASSEIGELVALLRWVDNRDADAFCRDPRHRPEVVAEVADAAIALLLLADRLGVDLAEAVREKIAVNRRHYPVELARGNAERVRDGEG